MLDKWYIFNKIDLLKPEELEIIKEKISKKIQTNLYFTSAINKENLELVCHDIWEYLKEKYYG